MGVPTIEIGRLEMLSWRQSITEVEAVRPSGYAYLLDNILFDVDLPGTTPSECTEPDVAMILIVRSVSINRKPWVVLGAGRSSATLEGGLSWLNELLMQTPLRCPATGKVSQSIVSSTRQIPCA